MKNKYFFRRLKLSLPIGQCRCPPVRVSACPLTINHYLNNPSDATSQKKLLFSQLAFKLFYDFVLLAKRLFLFLLKLQFFYDFLFFFYARPQFFHFGSKYCIDGTPGFLLFFKLFPLRRLHSRVVQHFRQELQCLRVGAVLVVFGGVLVKVYKMSLFKEAQGFVQEGLITLSYSVYLHDVTIVREGFYKIILALHGDSVNHIKITSGHMGAG